MYSRVRATIALTVSRASLYDPPNRLGSDLLSELESLLRDRTSEVREALREDTLVQLVRFHLQQLVSVLWDQVAPQRDLLVSTALGMAGAHYLRPQETKQVLDNWLQRARRAETSTQEQRRHREHALAIVAYAYGLLVTDARGARGQGAFSAEEIFGTLRGLLTDEESSVVRSAALVALILQASTDFETMAPYLQDTVEHLALEERSKIVSQMVELYLHQRRELSWQSIEGFTEPDVHESVDGVVYGLWIESERPPTRLETMLNGWLDDESRPAALQLAIECSDALARTRLEKLERELREREPVVPEPEPDEEATMEYRPVLRQLSFSAFLATLWVALRSRRQWKAVQAALPEVLRRLESQEPDRLRLLAELWNRGKPEWRRLGERETWRRLVGVPKKEGLLVVDRLSSSHGTLARQIYLTVWIHCLRWPLLILTILLLTVFGLVIG